MNIHLKGQVSSVSCWHVPYGSYKMYRCSGLSCGSSDIIHWGGRTNWSRQPSTLPWASSFRAGVSIILHIYQRPLLLLHAAVVSCSLFVCCGSCNFFNWMLWINFFRCYHHRYHKLFIYLTADFHTLRAWPSVEAQTNNDMPEREFSILELSWYITNRFRVPNNIIWKTWMCMWLCLPGYLNKLFRKIKFGNLFWYKWQCN